ncbi:MAG: LysE family translocator [Pseudomonadota bacterium]
MNIELIGGLAAFAVVSSITPGPNNLMLMASGANYGFRRTIPHMLGVGLGFGFMVVIVGLGLMGLFTAIPASYTVLKVLSVLYLLYLAFKIGTAAAPTREGKAEGRPFNFWQAAAFQWVNPKAWTMALTSVAVYAPSQSLLAVLFVASVFALINLPCVSVWTVLGEQLRSILSSPGRLRAFNWSMAILLVASLYPVLATTAH